MVQPRRFHSNFLFFIPLTQGVLLITVLDFIKNAVYFSKQAHNLDPTTVVATDGQQVVRRSKDPAYVAAQYIYAIWLALMMLKAIVGFRANLKFNVRWMGIYNILFGCDTLFEFIRTTLGVIFQDLSQLDEGAVIRYYCANYSLLIVQCYCFFCAWIHLRWVNLEMPHLSSSTTPRGSLLGLMFPMAVSTPSENVQPPEPVAGATSESEQEPPAIVAVETTNGTTSASADRTTSPTSNSPLQASQSLDRRAQTAVSIPGNLSPNV